MEENARKCQCECKKHHVFHKDYVRNPSTCNFENGKHLTSIMNDSAITCNDIIEPSEEETNFNGKKATCKIQNIYILLAFLLITIPLLIAVSIYYYLIKYRSKQKHFFSFQYTNNE